VTILVTNPVTKRDDQRLAQKPHSDAAPDPHSPADCHSPRITPDTAACSGLPG